jgi:hypothetical protein
MLGENLAAELATSLLHIGGLFGAAAHLGLPDVLSIILLALTRILCDIARIQIQKSLEKKREARAKPAQEEDQNG